MTTLASFYALAAAAPQQQRRYSVGAAYSLYERARWGESIAGARSRIMSVPQYADALVTAGLDDDFALVDTMPGGGAGGAFTPTDLAGLTLWLRADSLAAGPVASWADGSGSGRVFSAVGAAQPTVVDAQINGLPVVRFTTDDVMTSTVLGNQLMTNSQCTIFYVLKLGSAASSHATSYENDGLLSEAGANMGTFVKDNAGTPAILAFNWDGTEDVASQNIAYGVARIVRHDHDNTNLRVSVNKAAPTSVLSGQATVSGAMKLGQSWSSGNFFEGDIGEIVFYNRLLNSTEIGQVETYLGRWGV